MFRFLTPLRALALPVMAIGLGTLFMSGCAFSSPAVAATLTPEATLTPTATLIAPPTSTALTGSAQRVGTAAVVTADATRTSDATPAAATRSSAPTTVCDPCMVMEITAAGQKFSGEVTAKGKEGAIEVVAFHHEVKSPRDAASGLATGRRQYQPIRITKRIDTSSPLLAKAMVDNTPMDVTLRFYRVGADGQPVQYYTIKLKDALVSSLSVFGFEPQPLAAAARTFVVPHVLETSGSIAMVDAQLEEVSLTFSTITMTNEVSKTSVEDSWTATR